VSLKFSSELVFKIKCNIIKKNSFDGAAFLILNQKGDFKILLLLGLHIFSNILTALIILNVKNILPKLSNTSKRSENAFEVFVISLFDVLQCLYMVSKSELFAELKKLLFQPLYGSIDFIFGKGLAGPHDIDINLTKS
jgi:hypothetical protein